MPVSGFGLGCIGPEVLGYLGIIVDASPGWILLQGKAPKNPQELRTIAEKFFRVELHEATRTLPWQLDLIIPKEGKL